MFQSSPLFSETYKAKKERGELFLNNSPRQVGVADYSPSAEVHEPGDGKIQTQKVLLTGLLVASLLMILVVECFKHKKSSLQSVFIVLRCFWKQASITSSFNKKPNILRCRVFLCLSGWQNAPNLNIRVSCIYLFSYKYGLNLTLYKAFQDILLSIVVKAG